MAFCVHIVAPSAINPAAEASFAHASAPGVALDSVFVVVEADLVVSTEDASVASVVLWVALLVFPTISSMVGHALVVALPMPMLTPACSVLVVATAVVVLPVEVMEAMVVRLGVVVVMVVVAVGHKLRTSNVSGQHTTMSQVSGSPIEAAVAYDDDDDTWRWVSCSYVMALGLVALIR